MATPTSAWTRWCVVGAVTNHGHHAAAFLFLADERKFVLRFRLSEEIVRTGFGDGGRRQFVVAGDHDGSDAHLPELGKAFLDAALHHVFEMNDAENFGACRDATSGVPPEQEIFSSPVQWRALFSR